ncbi:alpha-amylase [Prevotella sp. CAG:592]|nr:alpha-amylase [Prevotella sp. CAG:592]
MEKAIIYQIFTRLFGNTNTTRKHNGTLTDNGCGKLNAFTPAVLRRIKELGATHVWYTGVIRHATTTDYTRYGIPRQHPAVVKGNAGSPYAITDYYDIDPDLATNVEKRMNEFESLVKRTHKAGLKMIIDFVPNHVARQYKSTAKPKGIADFGENDNTGMQFSPQNNFYYCPEQSFAADIDLYHGEELPYEEFPAKATGNDCFGNRPGRNDWYETVKLNYGVDYCDAGGVSTHFSPTPDTWKKMLDILLFWAGKGVDAFRCDMAEMVPSAFWQWVTTEVRKKHHNVKFIGEVYNPGRYREYINAGFDYLYDKVGMYDSLRDVVCGHRSATDITRQWQTNDDIADHMLYFLENHDEQRIASDFFAGDARKGIPALMTSALMRTNPFMLYAGQEYGERGMDEEGFSGRDGRTTIFDYWSVDSLIHGYSSRRQLTKEEKSIEATYKKVLNIATSENAVTEGKFFDLMYVNPTSADFNADRQYVFLRSNEDDLMIVLANFSDENSDCKINIPQHAFNYLNLKQGIMEGTDLLNGEKITITLSDTDPLNLSVEAWSGRVIKISKRIKQ